MKTLLRVGLVVVVFPSILACSSRVDAAFRSVTIAGDQYVYEPASDDAEFISNLEFVLSFYGESYRTSADGGLVISRRLAADMELLHNYTQKAHDRAWLEQQRGHAD